ncbi:MAG: hypothetical protein K0Q90_4467 [Paenibacillaceae bacterium]|jgi:hypothetical protein|nr:hypothetical protein [Paenibacillaceae bacterium]
MISMIDTRVGEHHIRFFAGAEWIKTYIRTKFQVLDGQSGGQPDLEVELAAGYGEPFVSFDVASSVEDGEVFFRRTDYLIRISPDFRQAQISVYDDFALKHGLMNLYSSYIVHKGWGILVHSSCVLEAGKAYLFAGHSGAGKSTVAWLSLPRQVLSDEATILKVEAGRVTVFDSPFRSGLEMPYHGGGCELAAIQFLRQSPEIKRIMLGKSDAMMELFGKIFYWPHMPSETVKIMKLFQHLITNIPVYELYFQKNDAFWKEIC